MLVVEQYLNIRLLLKQCPFCLEYLSEKKNKKGENAQKVKKNHLIYHLSPLFYRSDFLLFLLNLTGNLIPTQLRAVIFLIVIHSFFNQHL